MSRTLVEREIELRYGPAAIRDPSLAINTPVGQEIHKSSHQLIDKKVL
jgi:hypothetical protein